MNCCKPVIKSFFNALITIIPYTAAMQAQYGPTPAVEVWYWDPSYSRYYLSDISTAVTFDNNVIAVDHGGLSRGFIKIR